VAGWVWGACPGPGCHPPGGGGGALTRTASAFATSSSSRCSCSGSTSCLTGVSDGCSVPGGGCGSAASPAAAGGSGGGGLTLAAAAPAASSGLRLPPGCSSCCPSPASPFAAFAAPASSWDAVIPATLLHTGHHAGWRQSMHSMERNAGPCGPAGDSSASQPSSPARRGSQRTYQPAGGLATWRTGAVRGAYRCARRSRCARQPVLTRRQGKHGTASRPEGLDRPANPLQGHNMPLACVVGRDGADWCTSCRFVAPTGCQARLEDGQPACMMRTSVCDAVGRLVGTHPRPIRSMLACEPGCRRVREGAARSVDSATV